MKSCNVVGPNEEGGSSLINTRVVGTTGGPKEVDITDNVTYAVHVDVEHNAIKFAIFAQHLRKTHSKIDSAPLPQHYYSILDKITCLWILKMEQYFHIDRDKLTYY